MKFRSTKANNHLLSGVGFFIIKVLWFIFASKATSPGSPCLLNNFFSAAAVIPLEPVSALLIIDPPIPNSLFSYGGPISFVVNQTFYRISYYRVISHEIKYSKQHKVKHTAANKLSGSSLISVLIRFTSVSTIFILDLVELTSTNALVSSA